MVSSHSALRDLLEYFPNSRAHIDVVPFAVTPTTDVSTESIERTLRHYAINQTYFFLPNQFWQHKNHATAFRAVALAMQRDPSVTLVLSGQAVDSRAQGHTADLMRLTTELKIKNNIQMVGTIPHADLINIIAGARALINPSLFEGWSTTVEEAKALGTPMILSALNVHYEQADRHAVFFDPLDPAALAAAMLDTLAKPELDRALRFEAAALWSAEAQKTYAEKLHAVLVATIADGI